MNSLKTLLTAALITFSAAKISAQDFYDGCVGPTPMQLDTRTTYNTNTKQINITTIPKFFAGNAEGPRILVAAPIELANGPKLNGINLGYNMKEGCTNNAILALGAFRSPEGNLDNYVAQAYVTTQKGSFALDMNAKKSLSNPVWSAGIIPSYKLNNRWRVGTSLQFNQNGLLDPELIARYEIKKNHSIWAQAYINKNSIGLGLRINQ